MPTTAQIDAFNFSRQALAETLAAEMQGQSGFGQWVTLPVSGTFLSAPRRVGKSTFLRDDLTPVLIAQGHVVVYVDLWARRNTDPAALLHSALVAALHNTAGRVKKTIKNLGISKVSALSTLSFDLSGNAAQLQNASLSDLLLALADRSKTGKVVFIVDEAQEALVSETGMDAMFGLKAARDVLNSNPANPRLMLVCTGSSRSKLSGLVVGKQSPFYGAKVVDFPVLGKDFTNAYAAFVNAKLAPSAQLLPDRVYDAFRLLGHKPEALFDAVGQAIARMGTTGATASDALLAAAQAQQQAEMRELQQQFDALPPVQQAVLKQLIEQGEQFVPFAKDSLAAYAAHAGEAVTATHVQNALEALVQKDIAWQVKRGGYQLDDPQWEVWYRVSTNAKANANS